MSRGTVTWPKMTTAKQLQKIITRYETSMNEIVEATKRFDPESLPGTEGRWIRETAFQLQGQLHALFNFLADEERERK